MKFAVGDKVIMYVGISPLPFFGVVVAIDSDGDLEVLRDGQKVSSCYYKERAMHAHVYNSPLYQALN